MTLSAGTTVLFDFFEHELTHSFLGQFFFFEIQDNRFAFDSLVLLFFAHILKEGVVKAVSERGSEVGVKH